MKARMHFDTLTYANKLKAAGMDPKLAEVQALALVEAIDEGIATKVDIAEVKNEIAQVRNELAQVRRVDIAEVKNEMRELRTELKGDIATLKSELITWMVSLFITNLTLVGAFIAFAQFLNHSH